MSLLPSVSDSRSISVTHQLRPACDYQIGNRHSLPVVVVADDDVDNLILMSYVLEQFPCLLFCETDGYAALKTALKLQPDLMLLDIRLPRMSGLEIVRALREHEKTAFIPAIAITALASFQDKIEILRSGFSHVVTKPYLLEDIENTVSLYLSAED